jgi:type I restriction enzyme R subunit
MPLNKSALWLQELFVNNEAFHRMLTEALEVSYRKEGVREGFGFVGLILTIRKTMIFLVINQFTVSKEIK